jgi:protein phosphatase
MTRRVRIDIAARTHRGHVRESNEDAFVVFRLGRSVECLTSNIPDPGLQEKQDDVAHLMIVADGMGGEAAGEVASRTVVISVLEEIVRSPQWTLKLDDPATREGEIRDLLTRARAYFSRVHGRLRELATGDPSLAGMGTTFTGAYAVGLDVFVWHVGDSKAYLAREEGLTRITHDHTVAQTYADLGVITQEDVASHHMQNVLTRAVGGPDDEIEADAHHVIVAPGDRLLLCSDGLTGMASEAEIAGVLAAHRSSEPACEALVALALERGGRDNVTVIVAGFSLG